MFLFIAVDNPVDAPASAEVNTSRDVEGGGGVQEAGGVGGAVDETPQTSSVRNRSRKRGHVQCSKPNCTKHNGDDGNHSGDFVNKRRRRH